MEICYPYAYGAVNQTLLDLHQRLRIQSNLGGPHISEEALEHIKELCKIESNKCLVAAQEHYEEYDCELEKA